MKAIVASAWIAAVSLGAGCNPLGVCEGYSEILDNTYCYDGWTEDECDEYAAEGVNGAMWYFYEGQTCSER